MEAVTQARGRCPKCGAAFDQAMGAAGTRRCGTCGAELLLDLLFLELPPAGASPTGGVSAGPQAESAPVLPPPSPLENAPPRRVSSQATEEAPAGDVAWAVLLPQASNLTLPGKCVCCLEEATEQKIVGLKPRVSPAVWVLCVVLPPLGLILLVASLLRSAGPGDFPVGIPYCQPCVRHQRRVAVRRLFGFLAFAGAWMIYFKLLRPGPGAPHLLLGVLSAGLIGAGALCRILVPRFRGGTKHAREGKSAWIGRKGSAGVTMVFCNKAYAGLFAASREREGRTPDLRRKRLLFAWVSALLYGSQDQVRRSAALSFARPAITLGLMIGAFVLLAPLPEDEQAYRKFKERPSPSSAFEFGSKFRSSSHFEAVEEYAWGQVGGSNDPLLLGNFCRTFPDSRHNVEAKSAREAAEEEAAMSSLRKRPDLRTAAAFVLRFSKSDRAAEAKEIILSEIEKKTPDPQLAPPAAVVRRIFASAVSGAVKVRVAGFADVDYGNRVKDRLREALRSIGLVAEFTDGEAPIIVDGENGLNTNSSYSTSFGFGAGGAHSEYARASIRVQFSPYEVDWTASVSARSPATVKYTTYRYGGGPGFDTGPTQKDVHNQTTPLFAEALKPIFEYR